MRDILFRGKRTDNGEWIEGYYFMKPKLSDQDTMKHCISDLPPFGAMVDPDTVGQYTGFTDMNGKKIFEGDIIKAVLPGSRSNKRFAWPLAAVRFRKGKFGLALHKGADVVAFGHFAPSVTFEVMGNIHDNPELLEGSESK